MSTLIQEGRSPRQGEAALPTSWSRQRSVGVFDPRLDRVMAAAGLGAWSCDLFDDTLSWTSGVYDLFGLPRGSLVERRQAVAMYAEESRDAMERLRRQAILRTGGFALDAEIVRPDGERRWMRITGEMTRDARGAAILHGLKQDITAERARAEELRRLAENDPLTGLASRAVYESRFLHRRGNAPPLAPLGALVLFDLDGFKEVNDRLGHLAGDACLREFAARLVREFPDALLTSRIGGDEFAVIVDDRDTPDAFKARVSGFLSRVRVPMLWRDKVFTVGAASGIAVPSDRHVYDPEELFARADAALYAVKRERRRAPASLRA